MEENASSLGEQILGVVQDLVREVASADIAIKVESVLQAWEQPEGVMPVLSLPRVHFRFVFEQTSEKKFGIAKRIFKKGKGRSVATRIRVGGEVRRLETAPHVNARVPEFFYAPPNFVDTSRDATALHLNLESGDRLEARFGPGSLRLRWNDAAISMEGLREEHWHAIFQTFAHWRNEPSERKLFPFKLAEGPPANAQPFAPLVWRATDGLMDTERKGFPPYVVKPRTGEMREARAERALQEICPGLVAGTYGIADAYVRLRVTVDSDGNLIDEAEEVKSKGQHQLDIEVSVLPGREGVRLTFHPWDLLREGGEYESLAKALEKDFADKVSGSDRLKKFVERAVAKGALFARLDLEEGPRHYAVLMETDDEWLLAHADFKIGNRDEESKLNKARVLMNSMGETSDPRDEHMKRLRAYLARTLSQLQIWQSGIDFSDR